MRFDVLLAVILFAFTSAVYADDNIVQISEVMVIFEDPAYGNQDTITIYGENFQNKDNPNEVTLGEFAPLSIVDHSNFEIVALCPPNGEGESVCPSGEYRLNLKAGTSTKELAKFDLSIISPASTGVLSNRSVVMKYSSMDSQNVKSVIATCPPGRVSIAGGNRITHVPGTGNVGQAVVNSFPSFPVSSDSWTVTAKEIIPTTNNWQLIGYAICASSD